MKKIISASVLAVVLFASPLSFAMAGNPTPTAVAYKADYSQYSVDELTALIAQLTKQLDEMKKSTVACFVSDKDLSLGDGEVGDGLAGDVERLQSFLREKGYFQFAKNTGFFGKITRTSLMAFQSAQGISQTGDFDTATRAKAHSLMCTKTTVTNKIKDIPVMTEKKPEVSVSDKKPLTTIVATGDGYKVRWGVDGYLKNGMKIVWSKTSGPTYPPRSTDNALFVDGEAMKQELSAFDGAGTYYVRICEYTGSGCGIYSNETTVQIP